ncbi:MAG TPA: sigma-54 dependent transcriptional regulator [Polyangia bacterium]|nr:sigma-54 dependent transcriptional regulator [Polyangia bacterium]
MPRVLVADDEQAIRRALQVVLTGLGCEVVGAEDGVDALGKLRAAAFDLVVTDLRMPRADGFAVLRGAREHQPGLPVVVLTGHGSIPDCVAALRGGAANFLTKPFHVAELEQVVREALALRELEGAARGASGNRRPRSRTGGATNGTLIGSSPLLQAVIDLVAQVADTDATVLITGESGTGKEVVARLLHAGSRRSGEPLVAVNCGAIPDGLLESELFGHVRGAFTGATDKREGQFVRAHDGTLFLDEIGELPPALQVKLLRVLQDREVTPVGGSGAQSVDVRIVAATNRDLEGMVATGQMREDLYYRLNVVPIEMPPLRARPEDVPLLAQHFLDAANHRLSRQVEGFSDDTLDALCAYRWPGNVRELENLIERLTVVKGSGRIALADLPPKLRVAPIALAGGLAPTAVPSEGLDLPGTLAHIERRLIQDALRKAGGNKNRAAALLGLNRTTLVEKLKRLA